MEKMVDSGKDHHGNDGGVFSNGEEFEFDGGSGELQ